LQKTGSRIHRHLTRAKHMVFHHLEISK
jgi:hypothetical protein